MEWFVRQDIKVWSAMEGQQRFNTHADKLMNYIRNWQASGENPKTSVRTRTRLSQLTEDDYYTDGSVPSGYQAVNRGRSNKKNKPVLDLEIVEEEAEIVRLIFHLYVNEGYGAQRISCYLLERGISGRQGRGFPNTSNHILKNIMYTSVIKNGDARSPQIESLKIIETEIYESAQEIMRQRTHSRKNTAVNSKSNALLTGLVFCGHCGNRLTLTTNGRRRVRIDGSYHYEARSMYQCHYKVRHPNECDSQSVYGVTKLDGIIDQVVRLKLAELKAAPESDLISEQWEREIALARAKVRLTTEEIEKKQQELTDYRAEIIKIIRGQSRLTEDLLNSVIDETTTAIQMAQEWLDTEQRELDELIESADGLKRKYSKILTWADLYDQGSFSAKKMLYPNLSKRCMYIEIMILMWSSMSPLKNSSTTVWLARHWSPKMIP